jgi:hypothetical protein
MGTTRALSLDAPRRRGAIVLLSLASAVLGPACLNCPPPPDACPAGTFLVTFGTDLPDHECTTYSCEPIPTACQASPSCACLDGLPDDAADFNLHWCLDAGGCSESNGLVQVLCPGG